jgi:hypothetical protein
MNSKCTVCDHIFVTKTKKQALKGTGKKLNNCSTIIGTRESISNNWIQGLFELFSLLNTKYHVYRRYSIHIK